LRYEILGPLRVLDRNGSASVVSARKIETVLATLIIRSDQVVPFDQLVAEIWCDMPPRRAAAAVHVYISELRKFLLRAGQPKNQVVTIAPGYLLSKGTDDIDFHQFVQLMNEGRVQMRETRYDEASATLREALGLWRGRALDDLRSGVIIDSFVTWLTEARLECLEMLGDAQLKLGRQREMVGEFYSLIAENPFREAFYRQLMLALYRSERQADALLVYQKARKTLHDELGLEPCRALRELQRAILVGNAELEMCTVP
jgi:SARP family transcriptional regulator, regulator of embCAB operon